MRAFDYFLRDWRYRIAAPYIQKGSSVLDIGGYDGSFLQLVGDRIARAPEALAVRVDKLRAVTAKEVQDAARQWLQDDRLSVAELDPQALSRRRVPTPFQECAMPINMRLARRLLMTLLLALPLSAHAALPIQHWQTPQGTRVLFVESHELPILDIAVDFAAGSARDPAGKAGLAHLTHGLLDQGAGGLSDTAIAHRLADVGAVLAGSFDRDRAGVKLRTLSSANEKSAALDILARVLQRPDFPQAVISREKQRLVL